MSRTAGLTTLAVVAIGLAGCGPQGGMFAQPAASAEFISGNASTVLVDYQRGSKPALDSAAQIARENCVMFGRNAAVLESLNIRGDHKERATFLCQ